MIRRLTCLVFLWHAITCSAAPAAHTRADLLLSADAARPGDSITAGVRLRMDPRWHTYWRNPGAAGMATAIEWRLPPGVTAGPIQWPTPEKLPEKELTTYIYKDEVVLLTELKLSPDLRPGDLQLSASVSWLECEILCVPGETNIASRITIGAEQKPSNSAATLESWRKKLPETGAAISPSATWENAGTADSRSILITWKPSAPVLSVDFYPDANADLEVQPDTSLLPGDGGAARLRVQAKKLGANWPAKISGLIVQATASGRAAYDVSLPLASAGQPAPASGNPIVGTIPPLWRMLLYALLGGIILNIMPCVLPVIALKILGFVNQSKDEPGRVRFLGVVYGAGVLVSFLALAGLVLAVKAAGHKAGWGMQFSSPQFLVVLTVLVTLVALNLFGLFEITLSGRAMTAASGAASRHGPAGAFFNGVLATALATPCTAPLLSAALGFAFTQSALYTLLIFVTIGIGLALPYVVLSWNPAWLKLLPKPGAWMERFKVAMGFPMLATSVWLFSLLPIHYGDRSWWLGIFLVIVAFAAWVYGQFVQRGASRRPLAAGVVVLLLAGGYLWAVEGGLKWRSPGGQQQSLSSVQPVSGGVSWQPWSPEAVQAARTAGRPVLVDFTAQWCLTCNTIVKPALENPAVGAKLKEIGAVALLGDYTRFPPAITDELNRFNRAGVPLVLVYPKDPAKPAAVLPEALTAGMVVSALEKAVK